MITPKKSLKNIGIMVLIVVLISSIMGYAWWKTSTHNRSSEHAERAEEKTGEHAEEEATPAKGPHGGRLFKQGDFSLEVKIFEQGVEPQLRLYAYQNSQALDPKTVQARVLIRRLDANQQISFKPEADYLLGDQVIYEPHSFDVSVQVKHANTAYTFAWSQQEGRVMLADAALNSSGLTLLTAQPRQFASQNSVTGELQLRPEQHVAVTARSAGVVLTVHPSLGATVRAGEVLAVIESRELVNLRAAQRSAQQQLELAKTTLSREERLWREKVSPENDYLQAKTQYSEAMIRLDEANQVLAGLGASVGAHTDGRFAIRAPISGVVLSRTAVVGQAVGNESVLFEIADLSQLLAVIKIPEAQAAQARLGLPVRIQAQQGEQTAQGDITYLASTVDEATRTVAAHVRFNNVGQGWRVGQQIHAHVVDGQVNAAVAVREDALQTFRDWTVVFVRVGDQFEVRPVELGQRADGFVEVLSGLQAGQVYAAGNSFLLKAELGKAGASHDH
ncbi:MAG: efflux RND transporter periplasmic adaptor subunit [Moraxellaceae bacterium]